jgi:ABC-type bacteriocin/lantibiotic exporter with double-glycine peptidase domain
MRLTEPDRFPEAVRNHDVSPYLQEPEQCGPFALASLLNYMGVEADPNQLAERLYSPGAGGTLTMDLYLEAARRGLEAKQLSGSDSVLLDEIREHNPVIVLLKYRGLKGRAGHFVLVSGYSVDPPGYFVLWGDGRLSWIKREPFGDLWSGSGSWMLTVRGKGKM